MMVSTQPAMISPGDDVVVTLTIDATTGSVAGVFIDADSGTLSTIAGQGLAQVASGLTHSSPKSLSGGQVEFSWSWSAPAQPGSVRFDVWSLVGNGDGTSNGDGASNGAFDFVFGCTPQTYYRDSDGDGYGRDGDPRVACAGDKPSGYAAQGGDCDDNRETTHPGATELCDQRDDDCNGQVDDNAVPADLYPDADGDGYYGTAEYQSGQMMVGCVPTDGWAADPGDCKPDDPAINPGAEEVCNLYDDNCDGRIDENVRPQCGEGWCRREAASCDPSTCMPGQPRAEACDFLDDDCDGELDNGAPCDGALVCIAGECREPAAGGTGTGGTDGGPASSTTSGGTTSATGGASSGGTPGQTHGGSGCTSGGRAPPAVLVMLGLLGLTARRRRGPPPPGAGAPRARTAS